MTSFFYVCITKVVEVGREAFCAIRFQYGAKGKFCLCGIPYLFIFFGFVIFKFCIMCIFLKVYLYKFVYICILNFIEVRKNFREWAIVYMISQHLFKSNLITIGDSHIVHLVAEAEYQTILCISPACTDAFPYSNMFLCLLVFPVTNDGFVVLAEA